MAEPASVSANNISNPPCILEYFLLFQRAEISQNYHLRTREENLIICEMLARQSLFVMKLAHSPFFRAQIFALLLHTDGSWRAVRKTFRDLAPQVAACRAYKINKDYFSTLSPHLVNQVRVLGCNLLTWGNVMFGTFLRIAGENGRYFTNLLGYCQENGCLSLILPVSSIIQEMLVGKSLDYMAFSNFESSDEFCDLFMHHKIRYTLENLALPVGDWLFSHRGIDLGLSKLDDLLDQILRKHFTSEFEQICEILDDSWGLHSLHFSAQNHRDLISAILLAFWRTIPPDQQLTMLNHWPDSHALYDFLVDAAGTYESVESLLELLQDLQYGPQTQQFLHTNAELLSSRFGSEPARNLAQQVSQSSPLISKEILGMTARALHMGDLNQAQNLLDQVKKDGIEILDSEKGYYYWALRAHLSCYLEQWNEANAYFGHLLELDKEGKDFNCVRKIFATLCAGNEDAFVTEFEEVTNALSFNKDMMVPEMRDLYWAIIAMKGIHFLDQLLDKLLARGRVNGGSICIDFGHMASDFGFYDEGIAFFQRGLTLSTTLTSRATLLNNIGTVFVDSGKIRESIFYFEESIKLNPENGRTYLNLGKAYEFLGDSLKANTMLQLAGEKTANNISSPGEYFCTVIETSSMKELPSIVINYTALLDDAVKTQFELGDQLFRKIFPQTPDLQKLATSILTHYGNGVELLFHLHLGSLFSPLVKRHLKLKSIIPAGLKPLIHGEHVGLGAWVRILTSLIEDRVKGEYRRYQEVVSQFTREDLLQLNESARVVKDWRNPSDHAEIIDYTSVKQIRGKIILSINRCIAIFCQSRSCRS